MNGRYINSIRFQGEIEKDLYLLDIPSVQYLMKVKEFRLTSDITFLVGENGTGKSTLIEGIAVAYGFNAEGGTKNFNFATMKSHSELWEHLSFVRSKYPKDGFFLRAESFYNVATNIDEMDLIPAGAPPLIASYGGRSLHHQSHGESFLALVQHRFGGNGLYILDEPEAALSPMKLLSLMVAIHDLVKKDSQFIISTHSPILLAFPGAQILQLSEDGMEEVPYTATQHYVITKQFLEKPEQMLKYLLEEDG